MECIRRHIKKGEETEFKNIIGECLKGKNQIKYRSWLFVEMMAPL